MFKPWLFLLLVAGSGLCLRPALADDSLAAALEARLEKAQAEGFSGHVLVADGEQIVYERTVGMADAATGTRVTTGTRFNLASTGKLFTSVAILQLVEQGKLDLDTPIGRYLPDWPVATVRNKVTARQLLMHTSGLGSYWGPAFDARRAQLDSIAAYDPLLATEPAFEPGQGWAYSNTGYQILARLVEAVSGQDYYDYLARHVFGPAGMQDTGFFAMDDVAGRVATPRVGGTGPDRDRALPMPEPRGGGAGGGYSTARDLLAFHRALTGGRLLDGGTLEQMFAPVVLPKGVPPHGLGMLRYAAGDDVGYGHPGGSRGVGVDFRAARRSGWALVVMANTGDPNAMMLGSTLAADIAAHGGPDLGFPGMRTAPRPSAP